VWLRAALAGDDGPGRRALPAGELFHPVTLVALVALVVNDWVLKPGPAPVWLVGKLSDVAGLIAAPLVATAALDAALWLAARAGLARRVDFSLGPGRLVAAAAACGAAFAAVKLSPTAARALEHATGWVGLDWHVVSDTTDLLALPALAGALAIGWREIARVPLGRIEVLERGWRAGASTTVGLGDVARASGQPEAVRALGAALDAFFAGGGAEPAQAALDRLRRPSGPRAASRPSPKTPG
jgi:hypothetical protein